MGILVTTVLLVCMGGAEGLAMSEEEREKLRREVCPKGSGEVRYGSHAMPKHVLYTGKTDGNLRNLTWGDKGVWPVDMNFVYYNNDDLDNSMKEFSKLLEDEIKGDVFEAYSMLRPWAYRADLWRYCVLWACGGIYVDSKLAIAEPFYEFLWNIGFNPVALADRDPAQLFSCRDDLASESLISESMAVDKFACIWQGLLISEPGNRALLSTIQWIVDKVNRRWYPPLDDYEMPWLFLTGPGAIALATQIDNPNWENHVKLRCRMTYTPKTQLHEPLKNPHLVGDWHLDIGANYSVYDADMNIASFVADAGLHETQRTNDYGKLFKAHLVYMDDQFNESFALLFKRPREVHAGRRVARWGHFGPQAHSMRYFHQQHLHYLHKNGNRAAIADSASPAELSESKKHAGARIAY